MYYFQQQWWQVVLFERQELGGRRFVFAWNLVFALPWFCSMGTATANDLVLSLDYKWNK